MECSFVKEVQHGLSCGGAGSGKAKECRQGRSDVPNGCSAVGPLVFWNSWAHDQEWNVGVVCVRTAVTGSSSAVFQKPGLEHDHNVTGGFGVPSPLDIGFGAFAKTGGAQVLRCQCALDFFELFCNVGHKSGHVMGVQLGFMDGGAIQKELIVFVFQNQIGTPISGEQALSTMAFIGSGFQ